MNSSFKFKFELKNRWYENDWYGHKPLYEKILSSEIFSATELDVWYEITTQCFQLDWYLKIYFDLPVSSIKGNDSPKIQNRERQTKHKFYSVASCLKPCFTFRCCFQQDFDLKLVFAIFYEILIFHQLLVL